jgi:hypothetical protein
MLTSSYSYTLAANFRPRDDYRADIRQAGQAMRIVVGSEDDLFHADRYAEVFAAAGRPVPVHLVQGVSHIGLTLDEPALKAIVAASRD